MKIKHFLLASVAAFAFASCSDDINGPEGNNVPDLQKETTSFVQISLFDAQSGSRAFSGNDEDKDYTTGTPDENKVDEIMLCFFDAGRNYVGASIVPFSNDGGVKEPGTSNTVGRVITTVAQVDLPANINYPKYVVAYVNPTSAKDDLKTDKLEDVMRYIRNASTVSHKGYRTMNNSVYFDDNTGYTRFATEVNFNGQFFKTREEALKGESPVEIYVERVEAKVEVLNSNGTTGLEGIKINPVSSTSGVTTNDNNEAVAYNLTFVPDAWFVNGTEKRTFLIKNYRSDDLNYTNLLDNKANVDGQYGVRLGELKDRFKMNPSDGRENLVNDMKNFRSYWAFDPTYFNQDGLYPAVSYQVQYGSVNNAPTVEGYNTKEYSLAYKSYTKVLESYGENTNYVTFNNGKKECEYVLENTVNRATLLENYAKAALTSVVVLGHYVITDNADNEVFNGKTATADQEFYVRHEGDGSKQIMLSDEQAIEFFVERSGSTLFVQEYDQGGEPVEGKFVPLRAGHLNNPVYGVSHDDFKIIYPTTAITGGKVLSEQWRTMQFNIKNGDVNTNIYTYDYNTNKYRHIEANDIKELNDRLYSAFGVLERFQAGKAFFNVPLKHIFADVDNHSNKIDTEKVGLGEYGVVRNHIYRLTINGISGLGTGIGDINQPIVPPTETEQYYINARLNILKWRIVNQSVDL